MEELIAAAALVRVLLIGWIEGLAGAQYGRAEPEIALIGSC